MFRFTELQDTNNFRIIQVDSGSPPNGEYSYAVMFDDELHKWVRYDGDVNQLIPFISQPRSVIYSAVNKYNLPIVTDYIDNRFSLQGKRFRMGWLDHKCLSNIGKGWVK